MVASMCGLRRWTDQVGRGSQILRPESATREPSGVLTYVPTCDRLSTDVGELGYPRESKRGALCNPHVEPSAHRGDGRGSIPQMNLVVTLTVREAQLSFARRQRS